MSEKTEKKDCKAESPGKPLVIFYDCEAAHGNLFQGDIIEIAARCDPSVVESSFEALIKSSQDLGWFAIEKCGITKEKLADQSPFAEVIGKFLRWVKNVVKKASKKNSGSDKYFPVLCAHGGFGFDFIMLLGNMKRHNVDQNVLRMTNLHFADSFDLCKELQANNCKTLSGIRLSMDSLFAKFCPGKEFLNRHRAMGDVSAMVDIFTNGPLKMSTKQLKFITANDLCDNFEKQYSLKAQQLILEEKMSKLDAYTKCVNLKKLLQIQLTYEGIQRIFENCCSFMDFYECMKDLGIDRKTSKHFACQFGGMGLCNQGTVPHRGFMKPHHDSDSDHEVHKDELDLKVNLDLLNVEEEHCQRPVNVPEVPPNEFTITETTECWDTETDTSRSFVIQLTKPEPILSVTIDDFVSPKKRSFKKEFPSKMKPVPRKNKTNRKKNAWKHQNKEIVLDHATCDDSALKSRSVAKKVEPIKKKQLDFSQEANLKESDSLKEPVTSLPLNLNCKKKSETCWNKHDKNRHCGIRTVESSVVCSKDSQPSIDRSTEVYPSNAAKCESKQDCVVFVDCEQDEQEKDWPREMILIGDIPIYVPVEPETFMTNHNLTENEPTFNEDQVGLENAVVCDHVASTSQKQTQGGIIRFRSSSEVPDPPAPAENCSPDVSAVEEKSTSSETEAASCLDINGNHQLTCNLEHHIARISPTVPSGYCNPYVSPEFLYAMSMNHMNAQWMTTPNVRMPGQSFAMQTDSRYVPNVAQDAHHNQVGHFHCYEDEQIVPYYN